MKKPSLPKGTRDFSSGEVLKREFVMDILRKNFRMFGYEPLETPSFENLETLTGKYGEEGDRLIFKILNSGDYLSKVEESVWMEKNTAAVTPQISEKALRYDLTVPFARYVVMNHGQLSLPFKRYQMQPVWRADRPQKGRFREFYQCDADVVGSTSLWLDVELLHLYRKSFSDLGIPVQLHVNNRKILAGIAAHVEAPDLVSFTITLDKLDKIGIEKVLEEWEANGISRHKIDEILPFLTQPIDLSHFSSLENLFKDNEAALLGVEELKFVLENSLSADDSQVKIVADLSLARGLDYYTGSIFEVKASGVQMGSIGGGGRYDNLTGVFGLEGMPGIGISFGLDRIILVMEELGLFNNSQLEQEGYLIANYGPTESRSALQVLHQLHAKGIRAELYPENAKMKKQFTYAEKKNYPFMIFYGEEEIKNEQVTVKNLASGEQNTLLIQDFIAQL